MIRKLFHTTVFRLSLVYALLFSTVAGGALWVIYWMAESQMQEQTDTRLQLETNALLNRYRIGAVEGLIEIIHFRNNDDGSRYLFSRLVHRQQQDLTRDLEFDKLNDDFTQAFTTIPLGKITGNPAQQEPGRLLLTLLPGGYQLLVVTDLKQQHTLLKRLWLTVLTASGIIFTLAMIGGSFMGYNVMHRMNAIGKTANAIVSGNLAQRIPVTRRDDEFDRLSRVLNIMLEKIQHLMQGMREVTDNLAHDLRNPLNRLRNRLESSQYEAHDQVDYPQLIQDSIQDVDDLIRTFNALLSIAQMESGVQRDDWTDVDLSVLSDELAEMYTVVAEEQGLTLTHKAETGLHVHGNRQLLAQAITNLLDNAVKYTPEDGNITLDATQRDNQVIISITDNGPGIPEDQYEQVFKRFTRLDNARSSPGNGLGLSLVKAVADLHGAEIRLEDNHPGLKASLLLTALPQATAV
jgi:signal transduction histidine kinase